MSTPDRFALHHALVAPPGATPTRWMLVLHGVFGSGANLRSLIRRLAAAPAAVEPGAAWGFVLVDLRGHGLSQGATPPHTLDAAAEDLARLEDDLGLRVGGVMGHSFGGKVALAYMARRGGELERAFLLDADPAADPGGQRSGTARGVLDLLAQMPQPLPSREAFIEAVEAAGHARGVADWLAMNLRRAEDGLRLRLDLEAIRSMLDDYFAQDLWPVVEDERATERLLVVLGGRSDTVSPASRARLATLAEASARVSVRVLERAGHWLHVDDPDGLLDALGDAL